MSSTVPGFSRDKLVVDEICNIIKKGCTLQEFKRAVEELTQNEETKDEEFKKDGNLTHNKSNFDFSTIGNNGWSILHTACSSGNHEIVEYLL